MFFVVQIEDVYITTYETCGLYWPYIHHYIIVAIILMQVTMIGLFGLKAKPSASFSVIPLMVITILFNEYCKIRFLPTFNQVSVQVTTLFHWYLPETHTHTPPPPLKGELKGSRWNSHKEHHCVSYSIYFSLELVGSYELMLWYLSSGCQK